MQFQSCLRSTTSECFHHLRDLSRNDIRGDTDHSLRTNSHERKRERIISAQNFESRTQLGPQLAYAITTPAGFLDADDCFARLRETFDCFHSYFNPASARNAVEHNRQ